MSRTPGTKPSIAFSTQVRAKKNLEIKLDFISAALGQTGGKTHLKNPKHEIGSADLLHHCPRSVAAFHVWASKAMPSSLVNQLNYFKPNGPKTLAQYVNLALLAKRYIDQVNKLFTDAPSPKNSLETMASLRRKSDENIKLRDLAMLQLHVYREEMKFELAAVKKEKDRAQSDLRKSLETIAELRSQIKAKETAVSRPLELRRQGPRP